jgi:secretion/DNA translocation related TadE-like protein
VTAANPDRGSATVLVLAATAVVGLTAVAVTGITAAVLTRHRAAAAADAAALSGARATGVSVSACAVAAEIATADGASGVNCRVAHGVVEVAVRVTGPPWLPAGGSACGHARAGPAGTIANVPDIASARRNLPWRASLSC